MNALRWLKELFPAAWLGLTIGIVAAALHVQTVAVKQGIAEAAALALAERARLITDISTASAERLEDKLQELQNHETRVEQHFTTEIIKPIFTNVCSTDEYVRMFNEAAEAAERALSGQPREDVPDKSATAKR